MEIVDSAELRWFLSSEDESLRTLMRLFDDVPDEGSRIDHYLLTERTDLGWKVRLAEGQAAKIEAKYLVGAIDEVRLTGSVVGNMQRWRKISVVADVRDVANPSTWMTLKKERRLRKLALSAGRLSEVHPSAIVDAGCGIELTRLSGSTADAATTAWTVGFEAFGPRDQLIETLLAAAHGFFDTVHGADLRAKDSLSYPEWIRRLTADT